MRLRTGGFSFIEVLLLVAISVVLVTIILPVYSSAKKKGYRTACLSNLRQMGMSIQLYAQDNDEFLPPWKNSRKDINGKSSPWHSPENLFESIMVKVRDPGVFFCRADFYAGRDIDVFGVNHRYSSYFFNFTPPGAPQGIATISGVYVNGRLNVPPADYLLIRDANVGIPDRVDGKPAMGCNHFDGVNALFLDLHAQWVANDSR